MRIAILGSASNSLRGVPWKDADIEFWAAASFYKYQPKLVGFVDQWFELHPLDRIRHKWLEWAIENQPTCSLQEIHSELKHSSRYPVEHICERFGRYFTSTISFMVASAIDAGAKQILLFGIDLCADHEYVRQRPNFEYIVGVARGMGIEVFSSKASPTLQSKWMYGYERPPGGWSAPVNLVMRTKEGKNIIAA